MAATVRMDVKEVLRHFKELDGPRSSVNRLHPLDSVVVIAISNRSRLAVPCGCGSRLVIREHVTRQLEVEPSSVYKAEFEYVSQPLTNLHFAVFLISFFRFS